MSSETIRKFCGESRDIYQYEVLGSTNAYVLEAVRAGKRNIICTASRQTEGRGRMGRTFYSGRGGIYFSFTVRFSPDAPGLTTLCAGAAAVHVLNSLFGLCAEIKWVNDIICRKKKLCGILSQAGPVNTAVVGIGINYEAVRFPAELRDIATSVSEQLGRSPGISSDEIIGRIIARYDELASDETLILSEYRRNLGIIGRKITYNDNTDALCVDIDKTGALIIQNNDGLRKITSGEIRIKYE